VFIGGFSQGCAVALATYIRYKDSLGGVCGCSGFHAANINWRRVDKTKLKKTPVFISHGDYDQMVPEDFAKGTYARLRENGLNHTKYFVDEGTHHALGKATIQ
jgi:phospholipase/carboxylesterase